MLDSDDVRVQTVRDSVLAGLDGAAVQLYGPGTLGATDAELPALFRAIDAQANNILARVAAADEARLVRLREGRLTVADARVLLDRERAAPKPTPDFIARLNAIIASGENEGATPSLSLDNMSRETGLGDFDGGDEGPPPAVEPDDPRAVAIVEKWVLQLGGGFHPDTRGADYVPPLSRDDVLAYDRDMTELANLPGDEYGLAIAALETRDMRATLEAAGFVPADGEFHGLQFTPPGGGVVRAYDRKGLALPRADDWALSAWASGQWDEAELDYQSDDGEHGLPFAEALAACLACVGTPSPAVESPAHTVGPWAIRDLGLSTVGIFSPASEEPSADLAKVYLCDPKTRKRTPEFRANAHVFAAGPTMLAALKLALPALEVGFENCGCDPESIFAESLPAVRLAIAKGERGE